ncbi:MAG: DUF885 family protein [Clostridiales bacterium]|nr:DUF885 family protein [Clostridiales bacterium]
MKKLFSRAAALLLAFILLVSATGCFSTAAAIYKVTHDETTHTTRDDFFDDDDDDDWHNKKPTPKPDDPDTTDPTYTTDQTEEHVSVPGDGTGILTDSNGLTYPDGIASQEVIHPKHAKGTVTGQQAQQILTEVEQTIMREGVSSYVDAVILFDDYAKYGISPDGFGWGEYSAEADPEDAKLTKDLINKLYSIDADSLDDADRIFYDKVLYDLEEDAYMSQFTAFPYYAMELNPLVGPQNEVLFVMDVLEFKTKQDAENYLLVCKDIDRYYDQICTFEEQRAEYGYASSPDVYEDTAKSFDALVAQKDDCFLYDSFKERLGKIQGLSDSDRQDLISRHDDIMKNTVFPEFEECASRMRALKSYNGENRGLLQFKGGREYYECLFRAKTNSSKTIDQSTADLEKVISNLKNTMETLMANSMSWYMYYAIHDYDKGSVKGNLDFLSGAVKADFPEVPDHSYRLMEVPKVFEDSFSPAAYLGYHLDKYDSNIIIVNNGSSHGDLGVTIAHEGYPGHMLQSLYTRTVAAKHPYMFAFDSIGYAEGWATYCENYAIKYYEDNSDVATFAQINNELDPILTARCDIGIHCENWNINDCVRCLNDAGLSVSEYSFQTYYNLLVSDPTYSAKYGCGFVNTGMVMSRIKGDFPNASDKDIHTAYLNAQTGTFEQIEEHMRKELNGKAG